jgi:uncharacterized protein
MEFEWDEAKRTADLAKHDFANADQFEWTVATFVPDLRADYGEARFRAYAMMHGVLCSAAFTYRGAVLRLLGLRRANRRERRLYAP